MEGRHAHKDPILKLFMEGTDTPIEGVKDDGTVVRIPGYERGETLNAIFRALTGKEFADKHIVSGADTQGYEFDQKVAEGLLMILKALSEGKTIIEIAAHSRGAVESIIIAHKLQQVLDLAKTPGMSIEKFKEELVKIILEKVDSSNNKIDALLSPKKASPKASPKTKPKKEAAAPAEQPDDNIFKFKTSQTKTSEKKPVETEHTFDVTNLFNALSSPEKADNIKCKMFLMDPVPGQKNLLGSWRIDKFFKIPKVVKKLEILYQKNERTAFFEPILPDIENIHLDCEVTITPGPGHHGTASGFLDNQGSAGKDIIASDVDEEHGIRGKKTRHWQKLVIMKLIDFFDMKPTAPQKPKTQKDKRDKVPTIEKTIESCLYKNQSPAEKRAYAIKRYKKMVEEIAEFNKLSEYGYKGLTALSGKKRYILTSMNTSTIIDDVPALHTPPGGFINNEHIRLIIQGLMSPEDGKTGIEFIREKFSFIAECLNNPKGKHKDSKGESQDNTKIIDYFCKHKKEIQRLSGFFYLVLEPFLLNSLAILLDDSRAKQHKDCIGQIIEVTQLTNNLLAAVSKYGSDDKMPHHKNARKIHKALIAMKDDIFEVIGDTIENKIIALETALRDITATSPEQVIPCIGEVVNHRKSLLSLLNQLDIVKHAGLINEQTYNQLTLDVNLKLNASLEKLNGFLLQVEKQQDKVVSNFKKDAAKYITNKLTENQLSLLDSVTAAEQKLTAADTESEDAYMNIQQNCLKLKIELDKLKKDEEVNKEKIHDQLNQALSHHQRLLPGFASIDEFSDIDDAPRKLIQFTHLQYRLNREEMEAAHRATEEQINDAYKKKQVIISNLHARIELIEQLCNENLARIERLKSSDSAEQKLERAKALEASTKRAKEKAEADLKEAGNKEQQAIKVESDAKHKLAEAEQQVKASEQRLAEALRKKEQAEKLKKEAEQKAKAAHKAAKEENKSHAANIAKIKKELAAAKKEGSEAKKKAREDKERLQRETSFDYQLERLKKNIESEADYSTDEIKLMSVILHECDAIAKTDNEATKQKLTHTLRVVNDFVEERDPNKRNHALLATEAKQYTNSKRKSFQRLGCCMLALGILSLAAVIVVSALTFGAGLPLAIALTATLITLFAVTSTGSAATSSYSLFAAKKPKMQRVLKHSATTRNP